MPKISSPGSALWHHYNKKETDRGECRYCKAVISIAGGSVGNLKRHLIRKHPAVPLDRRDFLSTPPSPESSQTSSTTSAAPRQRSTPSSTVSASVSATGREKSESDSNADPLSLSTLICRMPASATFEPVSIKASVSATGSEKSESVSEADPLSLSNLISKVPASAAFEPVPIKVGQSSLTNFVNVIKPLPISKSKEIDIKLLKMICNGYHPFSIVEGEGFRTFIYQLCPSYQLPSKKTLSTNLLPQLCNQLRDDLQAKLNSTTAVALTTDAWTSVNNESFIAITAHYLNGNTKLHSNVLGCLQFSDSYTAENIANFLKSEATNWAINDKIVAVVTDNAPDIAAAVKICEWVHIPCYAHTINLIVKSGIKPIEGVVGKVKSLVQYFKSSSVALNKLKETQLQMNLPTLKLKQEVPTRWNSLFEMLVRVHKNKLPITSTLAALGNDEHKLTPEEWKIIECSIKLLEIFYEVTREVSVERTVSLSKTEILTWTLLSFLSTFENKEGLPPVIVEMSERMMKAAEERLVNMSYTAGQATLLDPRFKKNGFKAGCTKYTQAYDGIVNNVQQLLAKDNANEPTSIISPSSGLSSSSSFSTTTSFNLWEAFDTEVAKTTNAYDSNAMAVIEMDKYLSEMLLPRESDPLLWWEQRKLVYPHLYSLALTRLCIPASSVTSERIFSKAGQTLIERRSRLGPSKMSQIMFINGNL